ncbi:hypothetical protein GGF43_006268 [Coemansia sp. RSA 2618]|nr:hypothetical protein GGF43_006268 [Coemansia sp. RSA 2618]
MTGKRSWIGNGWMRSNGSLYMLTPIDPLFIYLSLITNASRSGDELKFVDVDNLGLDSQDAQSTSVFLSMDAAKKRALSTLCEVRRISDSVCVAKVDPKKVLGWLKRKCVAERLPRVLENCADGVMDEELRVQTMTREMVLLVSEYLQPYWAEKLMGEYGGFARVCDSEKTAAKRATVPVFDSPDSYMPGVADPKNMPALVKQEKPKTAKERQLEKAAAKSKPITSFFQKKK